MNRYLITAFVAMCLAQWFVPATMIAEQEKLLSAGEVFRFKTAPVDPADPFRGKYITLQFESDTFTNLNGEKYETGESVFAILTEDADGFAVIQSLSKARPGPERAYVPVKVVFTSEATIRVLYPFERFYLEESKAPDAEKVYRDANANDSTQTAYAVVRISNGKTALENVMINDRSIVDIVREMNAASSDNKP